MVEEVINPEHSLYSIESIHVTDSEWKHKEFQTNYARELRVSIVNNNLAYAINKLKVFLLHKVQLFGRSTC